MEPTPADAPEQARKQTILRAAVDIFASKGYHGCRIADVAKQARSRRRSSSVTSHSIRRT